MRCLTEFTQRLKWELVCAPMELKQGYTDEKCDPSREFARRLAERILR